MGPKYKKTLSNQCSERANMERKLQAIRNRKACKSTKFSPAFLKSTKRTAAKIVMRMRSGSSNLNHHLARKKLMKQEKKCPACGQKTYETPSHFLMTCRPYKQLRTELITKNNWSDRHRQELTVLFLGETDSIARDR